MLYPRSDELKHIYKLENLPTYLETARRSKQKQLSVGRLIAKLNRAVTSGKEKIANLDTQIAEQRTNLRTASKNLPYKLKLETIGNYQYLDAKGQPFLKSKLFRKNKPTLNIADASCCPIIKYPTQGKKARYSSSFATSDLDIYGYVALIHRKIVCDILHIEHILTGHTAVYAAGSWYRAEAINGAYSTVPGTTHGPENCNFPSSESLDPNKKTKHTVGPVCVYFPKGTAPYSVRRWIEENRSFTQKLSQRINWDAQDVHIELPPNHLSTQPHKELTTLITLLQMSHRRMAFAPQDIPTQEEAIALIKKCAPYVDKKKEAELVDQIASRYSVLEKGLLNPLGEETPDVSIDAVRYDLADPSPLPKKLARHEPNREFSELVRQFQEATDQVTRTRLSLELLQKEREITAEGAVPFALTDVTALQIATLDRVLAPIGADFQQYFSKEHVQRLAKAASASSILMMKLLRKDGTLRHMQECGESMRDVNIIGTTPTLHTNLTTAAIAQGSMRHAVTAEKAEDKGKGQEVSASQDTATAVTAMKDAQQR